MSEMQAGKLRRRIDIQVPLRGKDSAGGPLVDQWQDLYTDVPAAIESLSGREYFLARQVQSDVTAEITIRYRPGITAQVRLVHWLADCGSPPECEIYNVESVMPDATGRNYIIMMCRIRASDGFRADG